MKIIDKRQEPKNTTFADLCLGDCFLDSEGDLGIKISDERYLYTVDNGESWDWNSIECTTIVIPLEATLTIISKK